MSLIVRIHKDDKILIAMIIGFFVTLAIAFLTEAYGQTAGIYEDQLFICNFELVCQLVNEDDYLSKDASATLWNNFNADLDTFNIEELHD